jgi:hypothetical protein
MENNRFATAVGSWRTRHAKYQRLDWRLKAKVGRTFEVTCSILEAQPVFGYLEGSSESAFFRLIHIPCKALCKLPGKTPVRFLPAYNPPQGNLDQTKEQALYRIN